MIDARIAVGIAVSAGLLSLAVWIVYRRRMTPAERERRRRVLVNKTQRTTEATVTEATAEMIHFQYELRGVRYFASQDVSVLGAYLPEDITRLIGPVSAKYDPRNPANSIVVCEDWTGLPSRKES
ncbi:MAG: hypothetical protein IPP47_02485 [Bryobacterales bacterium]|nr:hypothetical protein [Bryobacterales bacterium]